MTKTALENAQELLEDLEIGGLTKTAERAIGWAIVAVAVQLGRIATQLEVSSEELSKHKQK